MVIVLYYIYRFFKIPISQAAPILNVFVIVNIYTFIFNGNQFCYYKHIISNYDKDNAKEGM